MSFTDMWERHLPPPRYYGWILVSRAFGERIRAWIYARSLDHKISIGVTIHPVTWGDGSGWSALMITVGWFFGEHEFCLFRWPAPPYGRNPKVVSFSEIMGHKKTREVDED